MKLTGILIIGTGLLTVQNVRAQKVNEKDSVLNRTIVVENQYNPEVMDAFKINVLPEVAEPAVTKYEIDYATSPRAFGSWKYQPMKAMLREQRQTAAPRGYARAAYGNMGNIDLKGSYLWDISKNDRLGVMVSMYGRNGDLPDFSTDKSDWKSRFYRTDASLDYRHGFRNVSLSLGGSFASQVFNYMPSMETSPSYTAGNDRQHYTLGEGYVGVTSVQGRLPVDFAVQTGFRRFDRKYEIPFLGSGAENAVHTTGYFAGAVNETQQVGIGFDMDNLFYASSLMMKDFTLVQLNPYYTLKTEEVSLRVGAHVDLQTANGSGVKWAPDVKLGYTFASSYTLFLQATGGTRLNDFRQLNGFSPYGMQYGQLKTSYTPLDARVGLKASPVTGFGFKIEGGYRITKDELFASPSLPEDCSLVYSPILQEKAKVAFGTLTFDYSYQDWIDLSLTGSYYSWNVDDGAEPLLWLKPQVAVDFGARAKIAGPLHVTLDYRYEGRKDITGIGKADPVNNLCVGAEYELFKRLNVFARLNNLLNRNYLTESGYPTQGFYVMAGLGCRF